MMTLTVRVDGSDVCIVRADDGYKVATMAKSVHHGNPVMGGARALAAAPELLAALRWAFDHLRDPAYTGRKGCPVYANEYAEHFAAIAKTTGGA